MRTNPTKKCATSSAQTRVGERRTQPGDRDTYSLGMGRAQKHPDRFAEYPESRRFSPEFQPALGASGEGWSRLAEHSGSVGELLLDLCATAHPRAAAVRALARHVAIPAKYRPVAARFERYGCWLTAARTDHWSALARSRTVAGSPLIIFLCHAARLATFRCRVTAFLKERLIGSGEGKFLPTIAALNCISPAMGLLSDHCTALSIYFVQGIFLGLREEPD